jgi:hypothetical protein
MRRKTLALVAATALAYAAAGCTGMYSTEQPKTANPEPKHPQVVIQGIDGTLMAGELMNGSITVDSGQGELTLLTDHVHSITLAQDVDKLDSDSMKVAGKVKDQKFLLRNEHGVFTLNKERLRKIDFVANPSVNPGPATAGATPPIGTVRATATPASTLR